MYLYFFIIRIAAFFGHKKARMLVEGQKETLRQMTINQLQLPHHPIWFHAASVGEFEQARPLIERLRQQQPERPVIVTFFSPSGFELRKHYDKADGVYYLPFATRANVKKWLDVMQPSMAIFVKYEFWPAYLRELKARAIPTYSICAIFRPGQLFFKPWGKRHLALLRCFTHIYVQDETSRALLEKHGISHCSIAGDTRFDRVSRQATMEDSRLMPVQFFVEGCERVIVAGSTWPKDEQLLAAYMQQNMLPTKLILVPHEIDDAHLRFIFNLFRGRLIRYTDLVRRPSIIANNPFTPEVLLIDTVGLLSSLYRFGHAAYIGGGFGVGIHNTIEAAAYGIPVLFGPNYTHFREAVGLIGAGAARSVKNANELTQALDNALDQHTEIGAKAAAYVASETGATDKIYNEIFH